MGISTGAALRAATRILRALKPNDQSPLQVLLIAQLIVKECEIEEEKRKPQLTLVKGDAA